MKFYYFEQDEEYILNYFKKLFKEDFAIKNGIFYASFTKFDSKTGIFYSSCSSNELRQEVKIRSRLENSPIYRNNKLSNISQIVSYDDLSLSDPYEEKEIYHRIQNGFKSLLSINIKISNDLKYSFNLTSKFDLDNSKIIYHQNKLILNNYFNELKNIQDSSSYKVE
jgi:hypothetical protein